MVKKLNTPQQATGHQTCSAAELWVFDPHGSCQMDMQACPLGSLLAGRKNRCRNKNRRKVRDEKKKDRHQAELRVSCADRKRRCFSCMHFWVQ